MLEDLDKDDLPGQLLWSKKMGRKTDYVFIFDPSLGYMQFATDFLLCKKSEFKRNQVFLNGFSEL